MDMNKDELTLLELEGLEHLLSRIIHTYEDWLEMPRDHQTNIEKDLYWTPTGFWLTGPSYILYNFAMERLIVKDSKIYLEGVLIANTAGQEETPARIGISEYIGRKEINVADLLDHIIFY